MAEITSLATAASVARPLFENTVDDISPGSLLMLEWMANHRPTQEDFGFVVSTEYSLALKDPESEFGKVLCFRGRVSQIQASNTPFGKVFDGGIVNSNLKVVRFLTAGSTDGIVEGKWRRFCGILTERCAFSNVSGGQTQALRLVGDFVQ